MMTSVDANGTTTSKTISLSQSAIDDLLSLGLGMPSEPVQQQQHQSTSLLDNPRGGHASDSWTPAGATTSDTYANLEEVIISLGWRRTNGRTFNCLNSIYCLLTCVPMHRHSEKV